MGGCVSFNTTEPPRSESGENNYAVPNLQPGDNLAKTVSTPQIEVPFFPTRMLMNGSNECASTSIGTKGSHAMVYEFLLGGVDMVFCGLFDGHGPKGNLMSEKVRDNLPFKLLSEWRSLISGKKSTPHEDLNEPNVELDEAEKLPEIFAPLQDSFFEAFNMMDTDLKEDQKIDTFCSGATAVTVVKKGRDLLIGNLGKSRAILGTRDTDNNLIVEQLTIDMKPNLATELDRIRRCGGRVFPTKDEPNIFPHVSYRRLARADEFLILATHGVWDVLSNKETVDIVASAPCKELASKALVDHAVHAWRHLFLSKFKI
ncbi:hypothetical protein LUZ60_012598 [Juncus effusus]|nr:hypothetical protein LUZ60_012598 [Juncus effusus]